MVLPGRAPGGCHRRTVRTEKRETIMSEKIITLHGVVCTDNDEMTTWHSAHLTAEDAARAGAELARKLWARDIEGEEFPEADSDWDAMDVARGELDVRLEVEEIEISAEVLRAALANA